MSGCAPADRTARWTLSEPPRWTIRRTAAILAISILLLVVAGVPAWAGSSFTQPEDAVVEADTDAALTLTVTEPGEENEAYGDTARVVVTAPTGFTVVSCDSMPVGWDCAVAEDGTKLTLTRTSPVGLATTRDFGFTVHTSQINGQHEFRVVQADGPPSEEDPPATVSSRPAVTVTGGQDPAPSPTPAPPADDGGSQDGGGSQDDGGTQDDGATSTDPQPEETTQDDGAQDGDDTGADAGSSDTSTDGTSGGSTAPQRTQGRASGTTLEIIPGEETDDQPGIATPDVADDPAIAPPDDADDDSTAVAATGAQASEDPRGAPWQQWVGAAMLLAGGAVVASRRWDLAGRVRELEPLERLRRWRSR